MSFLSDLFSGKKSHIRATKLSDGFYRLEFKGKLHNKITAHVGVLVVVRDLASDSGFGHEWKPLVQLPYSFESPDWLPLPAVGVKFMDYPYSGSREIEFKAYFFYMSKPVLFNENTKEIINEHHAFHSLATTESITFQQPGIEDLAENREECKPLILKIALYMAFSDGYVSNSEKKVIVSWARKENFPDTIAFLNKNHIKLKRGESVAKTINYLNDIAPKNIKYEAIQLCLDVLAADDDADPSELKLIESLSEKFNLKLSRVQKMKDKVFVKLNFDTKEKNNGSDEAIIGLKKNLSKKESLSYITKEFRKWNAIINVLNPGTEKDNANHMLTILARLKKKYES